MKKILLAVLTIFGLTMSLMATNPVITSMPSLSIAPDAHAAGMGDVGVATNPDLNSQHWNPLMSRSQITGEQMEVRRVATLTPHRKWHFLKCSHLYWKPQV